MVDAAGNLFVADQYNNRIQKFSPLALPDAPTIGTAVAGDAELRSALRRPSITAAMPFFPTLSLQAPATGPA